MLILCACEESQIVTTEFRKLGHEAYSCDLIPTSGNHPEWHLQQNVIPLLKERSRTYYGIAKCMAATWGNI